MKFKFLGTAAAEAIPGLFCECEVCKKSRKLGGRALRSRSQALVDGRLLIDFPADTLMHFMNFGLDMAQISHCIVTHSHSDHLYPKDVAMLKDGYSHMHDSYELNFYITERAGAQLFEIADNVERAKCHVIKPFDVFTADKYTVTALPAIHDPNSGPVIYQISDGEKTMLYGNDTHYFHDDIWAYWEKTAPHFDFVTLDCTNAFLPMTYVGHMSFEENIKVKERMLEMGIADEKTIFVSNHFSHNGTHVLYDEFEPLAKKEGFLTSYDGMEIEF